LLRSRAQGGHVRKSWSAISWLLQASVGSFETENDSASFTAEGVDGTEHLEADKGRIDADLDMWGNPEHGVLLIYSKWGGGLKETYSSKGDLARCVSGFAQCMTLSYR
jgi:hypothetical protein